MSDAADGSGLGPNNTSVSTTTRPEQASHRHAFPDGLRPLEGFVKGFRLTAYVYIVATVLLLGFSVSFWLLIKPDSLTVQQADALINLYWGVIGLSVLSFVICAYFVCRFTYRAIRNLYTAGQPGLSYHPAWAVGSYFVPIVNLGVPAIVTSEIWHATHKAVGQKTKYISPISAWWASYLVANIASQISSRIDGFNAVTTVLDTLSCALSIISALVLLKIMSRIAVHQRSMVAAVFD